MSDDHRCVGVEAPDLREAGRNRQIPDQLLEPVAGNRLQCIAGKIGNALALCIQQQGGIALEQLPDTGQTLIQLQFIAGHEQRFARSIPGDHRNADQLAAQRRLVIGPVPDNLASICRQSVEQRAQMSRSGLGEARRNIDLRGERRPSVGKIEKRIDCHGLAGRTEGFGGGGGAGQPFRGRGVLYGRVEHPIHGAALENIATKLVCRAAVPARHQSSGALLGVAKIVVVHTGEQSQALAEILQRLALQLFIRTPGAEPGGHAPTQRQHQRQDTGNA